MSKKEILVQRVVSNLNAIASMSGNPRTPLLSVKMSAMFRRLTDDELMRLAIWSETVRDHVKPLEAFWGGRAEPVSPQPPMTVGPLVVNGVQSADDDETGEPPTDLESGVPLPLSVESWDHSPIFGDYNKAHQMKSDSSAACTCDPGTSATKWNCAKHGWAVPR